MITSHNRKIDVSLQSNFLCYICYSWNGSWNIKATPISSHVDWCILKKFKAKRLRLSNIFFKTIIWNIFLCIFERRFQCILIFPRIDTHFCKSKYPPPPLPPFQRILCFLGNTMTVIYSLIGFIYILTIVIKYQLPSKTLSKIWLKNWKNLAPVT